MLRIGFQTAALDAPGKRWLFGLLGVVVFLAGCEQGPSRWVRAKARELRAAYGSGGAGREAASSEEKASPGPASSEASDVEPPEQRSQLAALSYRLPAPQRVVALGELPNGLRSARAALRMAGVVDEGGAWIGGDTIVVQLGNRGALATAARERAGEHEAIDGWFAQLRTRAHPQHGDVIVLLGERDAAHLSEVSATLRLPPVLCVVVGNAAFVHAGLLPSDLEDGLLALNQRLHAGLDGVEALLGESRGPLRIPDYTYPYIPKPTCKRLTRVLALLRVDRLIVGRSPAEHGTTSACDGRLQRIGAAESGSEAIVAEVLPSEVRRTRGRP